MAANTSDSNIALNQHQITNILKQLLKKAYSNPQKPEPNDEPKQLKNPNYSEHDYQ